MLCEAEFSTVSLSDVHGAAMVRVETIIKFEGAQDVAQASVTVVTGICRIVTGCRVVGWVELHGLEDSPAVQGNTIGW